MKLNGFSDHNFPIAQKDEDGHVITQPRNVLTKKVKKGPALDSTLLAKSGFIALGDPYKSSFNVTARRQNNEAIAAAGHEKVFNPSKIVKLSYKPPYPEMTERVHIDKNFKDEEGTVMIAPRNIQTNPPKVGRIGRQTSFGGVVPYMEDDYNIPKELATKARIHHQSKL